MSRYILSRSGEAEIAVGWDNPLHTFFYQDIDEEGNDNAWIGATYDEFPEISTFLLEVGKRGLPPLAEGMVRQLLRDKLNSGPLTPLQRMMKERFGFK